MNKYRPDIDGLRALAVVPVILFHLGVGFVPGGFVGVDIFFVISGFLITRIIVSETDAGRFSLTEFYRRRIRRILPNLLMMILVTMLAAAIIMLPHGLKEYGKSAVAAVLSASNIYFWMKTGYFDVRAAERPLLHTWSLGVEEQYYIVFPLIVLLVARMRRGALPAVILGGFALSFALAVYQVRHTPNAAFYLPFGRWWELMTGSLLAIGVVPRLRGRMVFELLAGAGAAMILGSLILLNGQTPFPGLAALPTCLGTALIIYANGHKSTAVGRALALKPMVVIGLLSYSLYLWHWPVIVLSRYVLQRDLNGIEQISALAAIFLLATMAWRYLEQPFRHVHAGRPWLSTLVMRPFAPAAAASTMVVALGLTLWLGDGIPRRYPAHLRQLANAETDWNPRQAACETPSPRRIAAGQACRIGDPSQPISFAVVGDSFVSAAMPGLDKAARDARKQGVIIGHPACLGLVGIGARGSFCRRSNDAAFTMIAAHPGIRAVLLLDRWPAYIEARRFGVHMDPLDSIVDDQTISPSESEGRRAIARGLRRTVDRLPSRQLFIAAFLPEQEVYVPQAAVIRSVIGGDLGGVDRSVFDARNLRSRALLHAASQQHGYVLIDMSLPFCDRARCRMIENGVPLYADSNHLTRAASISYRGIFTPFLDSLSAQPLPSASASARHASWRDDTAPLTVPPSLLMSGLK